MGWMAALCDPPNGYVDAIRLSAETAAYPELSLVVDMPESSAALQRLRQARSAQKE